MTGQTNLRANKLLISLLLLMGNWSASLAQTTVVPQPFREIVLKSDTIAYSLSQHYLPYGNEYYLFFNVENNEETWEIQLYPTEAPQKIESVQLQPSPEYSLVDSLIFVNNSYFRGRIKFNNLTETRSLSLILRIRRQGQAAQLPNTTPANAEIKLLPFFKTTLNREPEETELFEDEEQTLDISGKHLFNVQTDGNWATASNVDYRLTQDVNTLRLQVRPHTIGRSTLTIKPKTLRPFLNAAGDITTALPPLVYRFNVKPNRLNYANADRKVVYFDPAAREGDEIQFENNRNFSLKKTYRIEDQEESGGRLIAELYTVSQLANSNKILCRIRTYALHRTSEGYLYIKDGDKNRMVTNFNILEKPRIDRITLMHEGQDWTGNMNVYPAENLEVKIEGTGLQSSTFSFDGAADSRRDSARSSDEVTFYRLNVPVDIAKRKITVFMNKRGTPYELNVREYQRPADFDFVAVNYGEENIPMTDERLNKPLFYESTIRDVNIVFDGNKIDEGGKLYGKQYLNIEIRVTGNRNELVDLQQINNVVVCPGEQSPRYPFYDLNDCRKTAISLNDVLTRKTYTMDPFTQIQITVSHNESKQGATGFSRRSKIFIKRKINLDLQVSFPAGLLEKRFDQAGYGNLSGISTAVLAQLSFYDPNRFGQFRPYKLGAGFIAMNAFNFSENANIRRDIGIVLLASLLPIRSGSKFSIPLYAGGGYLLKESAWFIVFGPGIQFNF